MDHPPNSEESIASNAPVNPHQENFTYEQFTQWLSNTQAAPRPPSSRGGSLPGLNRLTYAQFFTWINTERRGRQQPPSPLPNVPENIDPLAWDLCPCCRTRGLTTAMYHCEECEEAFHPTCASAYPPKGATDPRFESFVCILCYWTKRAQRGE